MEDLVYEKPNWNNSDAIGMEVNGYQIFTDPYELMGFLTKRLPFPGGHRYINFVTALDIASQFGSSDKDIILDQRIFLGLRIDRFVTDIPWWCGEFY